MVSPPTVLLQIKTANSGSPFVISVLSSWTKFQAVLPENSSLLQYSVTPITFHKLYENVPFSTTTSTGQVIQGDYTGGLYRTIIQRDYTEWSVSNEWKGCVRKWLWYHLKYLRDACSEGLRKTLKPPVRLLGLLDKIKRFDLPSITANRYPTGKWHLESVCVCTWKARACYSVVLYISDQLWTGV